MDYQKLVNNFNKKVNVSLSVETRVLDLYSEFGELSKEILKASNYGDQINYKLQEQWSDELGDCFYSLISLANETSIDLDQALHNSLSKYKKRIKKNKSIGSNEG